MSRQSYAPVTWLLPVKNGMPYLPETLESLASQTYKNFQILAWDNGSTDGTLEELMRWIPARLRGRVIMDDPRSLGGSLAGLVEMADTEFCARIDADDVCSPDRLEQQLAFLESHPEIALVGSQLRIIDENGQPAGEYPRYPLAHDDIVHALLAGNPIGHPSVLFRRSAVLAAGNYNGGAILEDHDLWFRLALSHKMANLPVDLVNYRIRHDSCTRRNEKEYGLELLMASVSEVHAPRLFGLTTDEAKQLCSRESSFAIAMAIKIANHLASTQGGSTWIRLRSSSFIDGIRSLTRPKDVLSRLTLAVLDRRKGSIWREIRLLLTQSLMKVPLGGRVFARVRAWRARHRTEVWRREQSAVGCRLDRSLHLIGREKGYSCIQTQSGVWVEPEVTIWISGDRGANPQLRFGKNVYVGRHSFLGTYQPIMVGDNALIGAYSYITSANHRFDSRDIPIMGQGFKGAPINIGEDVWVGTHVIILPGVTIGKGAIIGAGSVVNQDIPEYEIWGGVPARFIKNRP